MTKEGASLRGAKRRSNLNVEIASLTAFARNDVVNPLVIILLLLNSNPYLFASDSSHLHSLPPAAGVEDVSDRNYFVRVRELLGFAQKSVDIAQDVFSVSDQPRDPTSRLVEDLINTARRGVTVRIFLNTMPTGHFDEALFLREDILENLRRNEVQIHFVHPTYRLLDRLIIVDEEIVLEGGLSWTEKDLEQGLGSGTLSHSQALAQKKKQRLELLPLWDIQQAKNERQESRVAIPLFLMQDIKYLPAMVMQDDGDALKIYLALLREFYQVQNLTLSIPYETLGREIPADRYYEKNAIEFQVIKAVERLADRYGLIRLEAKYPDRALLKLNLPRDLMPAVGVPLAFFHENYAKDLSARGIYSYLAIVYRTQQSGEVPVWIGSSHNVEKDFLISRENFEEGAEELRRSNLIEIYPFQIQEGSRFSATPLKDMRYMVNPVASVSERLATWSRLRDQFGDDAFKKAREMAELFGEPEDPKVVLAYMEFLKTFSSDHVLALTQHVASLAPTSTPQGLDYLRELLLHESDRRLHLAA